MMAFGAVCSSMLICTPKQYFCEAGSSGLRQHGGYRVPHPSHHVHFYTSYDAEEWTCAETDIRTGFRRARIENDPRVRQLSFFIRHSVMNMRFFRCCTELLVEWDCVHLSMTMDVFIWICGSAHGDNSNCRKLQL